MPRREKTEYFYTCGHCAMTDTSMPLHISTIGDYDESLCLNGPGWVLLLHGDEWFCSMPCFFRWLQIKINEAIELAAAEEEDLMDYDADETYASDWPHSRG